MIFNKGISTIQWGENGGVTTGYPHEKEWSWLSTSYHIQRLAQDESRDPKVRAKTIKFLGGKHRNKS